MRNRVLAILALASLMAVAALPVAAQSARLTANIPFEFVVGGKSMPAGEYELWKSATSSMIVLRGIDQRTSALSLVMRETVERREATAETKLVFNRYGDQFFLREVMNAQGSEAFTLPETRAERELAKTATLQPTEVLAVLARR